MPIQYIADGNVPLAQYTVRQAATCIVAAADSLHRERADYVCDGVDDQVEIQKALDSMTMGGLLFLLDGRYYISSTINVPDVSGITIEGSGIGDAGKGTLLYLANGADCSMFTCDHATHVYFTSFKNFGMDGQKAGQSATSHGFNVVKEQSDIYWENMIVLSFKDDGIHVSLSTGLWNFWIDKCLLEANGNAGLYFEGGSWGYINDCYFYGNLYGIQGIGTELTNIKGSGISNNYRQGIYFQKCLNINISSSMICRNSAESSNTFDGVYLEDSDGTPCTYILIEGCNLNDYATPHRQRYGINLQGNSDYNLIANNNICNNVSGSINIGASVGSHNIIKDNSGYINKNSGTSTGTGAQQTIAHGLATTPTKVILWNIEDGANPYQSAAADGTNIKITAVINQDWGWEAEVV